MTATKVGKRNTRETDMSQRTRSRASSANTDADGDNGGATVATAEAPERESRESRDRDRDGKNEGFHNLADLKEMSISKLTQIAKSMDVPGATGMRKQELIFKVLAAQTEKSGLIFSEGEPFFLGLCSQDFEDE